MAFGAKKIYPIDQIPAKAVGVSMPFRSTSVFTPTYTTKDAIRNNLINFLLTERQERVFQPVYAGGIRSYVFEHIVTSTLEDIQDYIASTIERYFPNVQAQVQISTQPDGNTVFVTIPYSIINTGINDTIQISVSNG